MDYMVKPPEIAASRLQKEPQLLWNTFVKFLSKANTTEMNDVQMAAQLPFWYDSDIQNGGHLRYFENKYAKLGDKLNVLVLATLDALKIVGADKQAEILGQSADVYFSKPRQHTKDPDEISQIALEGEFEKFDIEYNNSVPTIPDQLKKYLMAHTDNFVKVI
jgi:hypothetical protein